MGWIKRYLEEHANGPCNWEHWCLTCDSTHVCLEYPCPYGDEDDLPEKETEDEPVGEAGGA